MKTRSSSLCVSITALIVMPLSLYCDTIVFQWNAIDRIAKKPVIISSEALAAQPSAGILPMSVCSTNTGAPIVFMVGPSEKDAHGIILAPTSPLTVGSGEEVRFRVNAMNATGTNGWKSIGFNVKNDKYTVGFNCNPAAGTFKPQVTVSTFSPTYKSHCGVTPLVFPCTLRIQRIDGKLRFGIDTKLLVEIAESAGPCTSIAIDTVLQSRNDAAAVEIVGVKIAKAVDLSMQ
ncbi:MAG: hypothetical protein AABZ39_02735 [Spirochaetota bacterium]